MGLPCPPKANIDLFVEYSGQLVSLYGVDAILISRSTMNRAAGAVRRAMKKHSVPVVQIDEAMMEEAVRRGGRILIVDLLGAGDVEGHNEAIAAAIREVKSRARIDTVVLAQVSMSVFKLSYPDPVAVFGADVLTSAETGFARARDVLKRAPSSRDLGRT